MHNLQNKTNSRKKQIPKLEPFDSSMWILTREEILNKNKIKKIIKNLPKLKLENTDEWLDDTGNHFFKDIRNKTNELYSRTIIPESSTEITKG